MKFFKHVLPLLLAVCLLCGAVLPIAAEENTPAEDAEQTESTLLGDVDGDGKVTTTDARLVMQVSICKWPHINYFPGTPEYEEWEQEWEQTHARYYQYGDVDGDERLSTSDARLILQYIVGRIDHFPIEDM